MKLTEKLKKSNKKDEINEQVQDLNEETDMELTDDGLDHVSGGSGGFYYDEETVRR